MRLSEPQNWHSLTQHHPIPHLSEPVVRAMPPLIRVGKLSAPKAPGFCIDERSTFPGAFALRVYPPGSRVGPGGIACSALLA